MEAAASPPFLLASYPPTLNQSDELEVQGSSAIRVHGLSYGSPHYEQEIPIFVLS